MGLDELINSLKKEGVLKSPSLEEALKKIDRKKFVPESKTDLAYIDAPLPIGEGQTISQPYTVIFVLELINPKIGEQIMDAGSGSGWQTGLLAEIVGEKGKIYAIEKVPFLCKLSKKNIAQFPELERRIEFYCQSAEEGLLETAQKIGGFDAIVVAAEVHEVPEAWRSQLKIGGRFIYPKSGSLFFETKNKDGTFRVESYPGFAFVPFITRKP